MQVDGVSESMECMSPPGGPQGPTDIIESPLACFKVNTPAEVVALFPKSIHEIDCLAEEAIRELDTGLDVIKSIPLTGRNFANTVMALDELETAFMVRHASIGAITLCHPEKAMRDRAREWEVRLEDHATDTLEGHDVFLAFNEYAKHFSKIESLSHEQTHHILECEASFRRAGHYLSPESFAEVQRLKREITRLSSEFAANIANDKSKVSVSFDELKGIPEDVIAKLGRDGDNYLLTCDYPVYIPTMQYCEVASTRKAMYHAYNNRATPENLKVLQSVIAHRDAMAKMIGYPSYAALQLEGQMAKTPETAQAFIDKTISAATPKALNEAVKICADLHPSVELTADGKIHDYDSSFIMQQYSKSKLNIDENKLSEYFPMETTIQGLFDIYQQFFNIDFKTVPAEGMWHESVQMIEVRSKGSDGLLGHIAVDLFPREGKYTHACCSMIVPPLKDDSSGCSPAVSLVIANFPKSTEEKPSLLQHSQVRTFFHEFGHAIHAVMGRAEMPSRAGYNTKTDFVEMPSQILEEWIYEKEILDILGCHYLTKEPIPEELVNAKIAAKQALSGISTLRQMIYANMSLAYYQPGADKDTTAIAKEIKNRITPNIAQSADSHAQASFGHLMGYGAAYYGYMWSKVFALDVFNTIKEADGLLDPEMGKRYIQEIIGKGGSCDPSDLLEGFLGRAPNEEAFRSSMGI